MIITESRPAKKVGTVQTIIYVFLFFLNSKDYLIWKSWKWMQLNWNIYNFRVITNWSKVCSVFTVTVQRQMAYLVNRIVTQLLTAVNCSLLCWFPVYPQIAVFTTFNKKIHQWLRTIELIRIIFTPSLLSLGSRWSVIKQTKVLSCIFSTTFLVLS